jgi:hypothetical protein
VTNASAGARRYPLLAGQRLTFLAKPTLASCSTVRGWGTAAILGIDRMELGRELAIRAGNPASDLELLTHFKT